MSYLLVVQACTILLPLIAFARCGVPALRNRSETRAPEAGVLTTGLTHVVASIAMMFIMHGAYKEATVYRSGVFAGNRVAFWESEAGGLRSSNYPKDEFIYVLEGSVVTTDANGTKHEFHAGEAFVLPKGWVGLWEMNAHFKKIIVNF